MQNKRSGRSHCYEDSGQPVISAFQDCLHPFSVNSAQVLIPDLITIADTTNALGLHAQPVPAGQLRVIAEPCFLALKQHGETKRADFERKQREAFVFITKFFGS